MKLFYLIILFSMNASAEFNFETPSDDLDYQERIYYETFDGGWRIPIQSYRCKTLEGFSFVVVLEERKIEDGSVTSSVPVMTVRDMEGELLNISMVRYAPGHFQVMLVKDEDGSNFVFGVTHWAADFEVGDTYETMKTGRLIYGEFKNGEGSNLTHAPKACIVF